MEACLIYSVSRRWFYCVTHWVSIKCPADVYQDVNTLSLVICGCCLSKSLTRYVVCVTRVEVWLNRFRHLLSKFLLRKTKRPFFSQCLIKTGQDSTIVFISSYYGSFKYAIICSNYLFELSSGLTAMFYYSWQRVGVLANRLWVADLDAAQKERDRKRGGPAYRDRRT